MVSTKGYRTLNSRLAGRTELRRRPTVICGLQPTEARWKSARLHSGREGHNARCSSKTSGWTTNLSVGTGWANWNCRPSRDCCGFATRCRSWFLPSRSAFDTGWPMGTTAIGISWDRIGKRRLSDWLRENTISRSRPPWEAGHGCRAPHRWALPCVRRGGRRSISRSRCSSHWWPRFGASSC